MPQVVPQPRIDTLVNDAATRESRRRTEYSGTVWWGQPPDTSGRVVGFATSLVRDDTPFFLPDSLPYRRSDLGDDAVVSCTVALQASNGETSLVTAAEASFADDPRGGDTCWIAVRIAVYAREPLAVAYRVVALCPPIAAGGGPVVDMRGIFGS